MYLISIFLAGTIYLINVNFLPKINNYLLNVLILIIIAPIITYSYTKSIIKIKNERMLFPIKKTNGKMKNIIIYQLGVPRKKQDLTTLVSTAADSRAARNRPKANKNKNMLPKGLGSP